MRLEEALEEIELKQRSVRMVFWAYSPYEIPSDRGENFVKFVKAWKHAFTWDAEELEEYRSEIEFRLHKWGLLPWKEDFNW